MAKGRRIVISATAEKHLYSILDYWIKRTGSKKYSKKLSGLFSKSFKEIQQFNLSGYQTDNPKIRVKIVKYYLIYYTLTENEIHIMLIRDGRMDPDSIALRKR